MASTTYHADDPTTKLSGVGPGGVSHKVLEANAKGEFVIEDDEGQIYDQTIRNAMDAGILKLGPAKKEKP
jgi:hypothetical protein